MTVALEDLKTYLGDTSEDNENDSLLASCLVDAAVLIARYVGGAAVPDTILDRCTLIVGADLFERKNAPNGIASQQYASLDGFGTVGNRIARDPMAGVYPILRNWVTPW